MNETFKRYLVSAGISFFTGFCIAILAGIDALTLEGLKDGAYVGLIVAGLRSGIKAAIEGYLALRGIKNRG
jgi:hypothetical protein